MNNNAAGSIATKARAVTKSDTAENAYAYLYVGGAGDIVVVTEGGDEVTLSSVPVGSFIWVRTSKIKAATTATNIVGFV
jgi:hypothetical protein